MPLAARHCARAVALYLAAREVALAPGLVIQTPRKRRPWRTSTASTTLRGIAAASPDSSA